MTWSVIFPSLLKLTNRKYPHVAEDLAMPKFWYKSSLIVIGLDRYRVLFCAGSCSRSAVSESIKSYVDAHRK